jgi:hypothetical protein
VLCRTEAKKQRFERMGGGVKHDQKRPSWQAQTRGRLASYGVVQRPKRRTDGARASPPLRGQASTSTRSDETT